MATDTSYVPRLRRRYDEEILGRLMSSGSYRTPMEAPRLVKITLNMGVGEAKNDSKVLDRAAGQLAEIAGQKPVITKAKKSIAGFKLREGYAIGCKVTMRGDRMWEFLDRLISVAIPRMRDFRGMPTGAFDGRGNYTFGISDQLIFPELDYDKIDQPRGMDISIVTTARTNAEGRALLDAFGFPFKREGQ